jgi:hypothetical protein
LPALNKIPIAARKWFLHLFLLPVFFTVSIYSRFAGLTGKLDLFIAFLVITAALIILFLLFCFSYKNKSKAALAASITGILYLFFGNIKELLAVSSLLSPISHYKILLPLLFVMYAALLYSIRKTKSVNNITAYLNILFLLYLSIEMWNLLQFPGSNQKNNSLLTPRNKQLTTGSRPDIYFIVADGYPSTIYQQTVLGIPYNSLDSFLIRKNFFPVTNARSNYNNTAFSMTSVLSMQYVDWMKGINAAKPYHYNRATATIKDALVFRLLRQEEYTIYNLSVFDIAGNRSIKKEDFLSTTPSAIIFYNTFWNSIRRDILPEFFPVLKKRLIRKQEQDNKSHLSKYKDYNRQVSDSLLTIAALPAPCPKFVYTHLEMPHFPYFYDSAGKAYPDELVFGPGMIRDKERFKNYVAYTNSHICQLITRVLSQTNGQAVIILLSDHGINDLPGSRKEDAFSNYSAFYFPDGNYRQLYTGMSNVNTFRVIFNKYFGQQLPLLSDSSIYIK